MKIGDLMYNEKTEKQTGKRVYVIFLGYNQWNEIKVMYPDGFIWHGCELDFKEAS